MPLLKFSLVVADTQLVYVWSRVFFRCWFFLLFIPTIATTGLFTFTVDGKGCEIFGIPLRHVSPLCWLQNCYDDPTICENVEHRFTTNEQETYNKVEKDDRDNFLEDIFGARNLKQENPFVESVGKCFSDRSEKKKKKTNSLISILDSSSKIKKATFTRHIQRVSHCWHTSCEMFLFKLRSPFPGGSTCRLMDQHLM